ncbi:MAG TPA: septal ring lytic transglycosylase RlpA family protein, partial [Roseiflexaceae bacterium]|nr:septal ring lytic transglycosylase RlpA family protein [Roseiflexaceae bacterium]
MQRLPAMRSTAALALFAAILIGCSTPAPRPSPRLPSEPTPLPIPAPEVPPPASIETIPDAVPRAEPKSARGNPPFYTVLGKRYFVRPSAEGYVERGVASWYGPGFHAARTSNGEPYDMYAMTAAHKTLPLPTYVQVTNLRNGRNVVLRVNDRGPFKDGRIIDLSYTAAAKLDMLRDGTTFVEVRALMPGADIDDKTSPASNLFVQAGAFSSEANATNLLTQLRTKGIAKGFVRADKVNERTLYRVRIGPIPSVNEFDRVVARLRSLGVGDAHLALD